MNRYVRCIASFFINNAVSSIYTVIWYIFSNGSVIDRVGDFQVIKPLGEGRFGKFVLAKKISTDGRCSKEVFTMKILPNERFINAEKQVLIQAVGHPFLVQLFEYFQSGVICSF